MKAAFLKSSPVTIFFLIALALITFSNLKVITTGDYINFTTERSFYETFEQYFINVLSYNRTRHIEPGDTFLFRPVYHGLHALLDNIFKNKTYLEVYISLAAHILSSFLLFQILRILTNYWTALLSAIVYLVQISSPKIIFDIHFVPYVLTNLYVLLALLILVKKETQKNYGLLTLLIFVAGCSHESIFLGVFIALALCSYFKINFPQKKYLLFSFFFFLLLNVWSFLHYRGQNSFSIGNNSNILQIIVDTLLSPFYIIGMNISGLFFGNLRLAKVTIGTFTYLTVGFFVAYLFYKNIRKQNIQLLKPFSKEQKNTLILCFSILISYILALSIGRGGLRGLSYLSWAIWDDYLTSPYWIIIVAVFIYYSTSLNNKSIVLKGVLYLWILQSISTAWHEQFFLK
jgi:hypothetical protein